MHIRIHICAYVYDLLKADCTESVDIATIIQLLVYTFTNKSYMCITIIKKV